MIEEVIRNRVRHLRQMDQENLYWTPLGIYAPGFVQFLVDKKILKTGEDEGFYVWDGREGYDKWLMLKKLVWSALIKPQLTDKDKKDKILWMMNVQAENSDYITMSITQKFAISKKEEHPVSYYQKLNSKIKPTEQETEDTKKFDKYEKICDDMIRS